VKQKGAERKRSKRSSQTELDMSCRRLAGAVHDREDEKEKDRASSAVLRRHSWPTAVDLHDQPGEGDNSEEGVEKPPRDLDLHTNSHPEVTAVPPNESDHNQDETDDRQNHSDLDIHRNKPEYQPENQEGNPG
jgi:hypothetical protein